MVTSGSGRSPEITNDRAYRGAAVSLTLCSALLLFIIGFTGTVILQDYRDALQASRYELPEFTKIFFAIFARRPASSALLEMMIWLWWPMVWSLLSCHLRYKDDVQFAIVFIFRFMFCWFAVLLFLGFLLLMCIMPRIILLGDVFVPSYVRPVERVISAISWTLPAMVGGWGLYRWLKSRQEAARGFPVVPLKQMQESMPASPPPEPHQHDNDRQQ